MPKIEAARTARSAGKRTGKKIWDERYTSAVIPPFVLTGLVDYARTHGVDPQAWFAGTTLTTEQCYEPDARVSFRQAAAVLRRALRAFPAGGVGLAVGGRESLASFGVLGFAMMSTHTFAEAASIAFEHHQLSGSLMDISFEIGESQAALFVHERFAEPALLRFLCEETFASSATISRTLLGNAFRPSRLELSYPAPAWAAEYRRLFRCPVQFGAQRNAYFMDRVWLDRKLPTHNPSNLAEALRLCHAQTQSAAPRGDLAIALELWLRGKLGQCPSAAQAAQAFHVAERTLRRQLADAGTSFQQIHDRVRKARAEILLRHAGLRMAEVAAQLGFSDAREFRRAFKRWTGQAPRLWAAQQVQRSR